MWQLVTRPRSDKYNTETPVQTESAYPLESVPPLTGQASTPPTEMSETPPQEETPPAEEATPPAEEPTPEPASTPSEIPSTP